MSKHRISDSMNYISVNEDVINNVNNEIKISTGSSIPQPVVIIGERGAGKTTVLRRIFTSELCQNKPKVWIDGRMVFSSDDIIQTVAQAKASIVFIDDFDFYLTRCSYDEQFRLRRFLNSEGAPMFIGTVSKVLPALTDYEAPFFEGMKHVYINPVSDKIVRHLFDVQTEKRADELMKLLPPTINSLKTVYDIVKTNGDPEKDTLILLSIFSDKYRNLYQNLPVYSQNILNFLGIAISPVSMPELRDKTGLPTNVLTAYLKTLITLEIVKADRSVKRQTKYSMRDPLFRLWLAQSMA